MRLTCKTIPKGHNGETAYLYFYKGKQVGEIVLLISGTWNAFFQSYNWSLASNCDDPLLWLEIRRRLVTKSNEMDIKWQLLKNL